MKHRFSTGGVEAGCDEAGRGCLAGPVCAAAVILPDTFRMPKYIRDSKLLNPQARLKAARWIKERAVSWSVAFCSPEEIDEMNILRASFHAMHRALDGLPVRPRRILVDGNRFVSYENIEHHCIVKGDNKYASIASASILAKVHRDRYMELWHQVYPDYDWLNNKGYPTPNHISGLEKFGKTDLHRLTFTVKNQQLSLF